MGRGKGSKAKVQQAILKRRGLAIGSPYAALGNHKLPPPDGIKTLAMRLLEARFDTPIAVLLQSGNLNEVAEFLGIDESTVSKWRLRLKLRNKKDNASD